MNELISLVLTNNFGDLVDVHARLAGSFSWFYTYLTHSIRVLSIDIP